MPRVFVSYRREDSRELISGLISALRKEFGADSVFVDEYSIPVGEQIDDHIAQSIRSVNVFLPIIGPRYSEESNYVRLNQPDDPVRVEYETASHVGLPILPVLVGGAKVPDKARMPKSMSTLVTANAFPVRSGPDYEPDLGKLIASIKSMAGEHERKTKATGQRSSVVHVTAALLLGILLGYAVTRLYDRATAQPGDGGDAPDVRQEENPNPEKGKEKKRRPIEMV